MSPTSTSQTRFPCVSNQPSGANCLAVIVVVCLMLASGSGCQVLRIPSYRADVAGGMPRAGGDQGPLMGGMPGSCESQDCPTSILPPMPEWLVRLRYPDPEEDLPEAPAYPRFHPLPTRPMFAPRPQAPPAITPSDYTATGQQMMNPMQGASPSQEEMMPAMTRPPFEFGRTKVRTMPAAQAY